MKQARDKLHMRTRTERKQSLLKIGNAILRGRVTECKRLLRSHIDATLGLEQVAREAGIPVARLKRMFTPKGELRARELFNSLAILQRHTGMKLHLAVE